MILLAALLAPAAGAQTAAGDEYTIDPPGVRDSDVETSRPTGEESASKPPEQAGVVGETEPPQTSLDALGASIGTIPALAIGLAIAVLAGFALARRPADPG